MPDDIVVQGDPPGMSACAARETKSPPPHASLDATRRSHPGARELLERWVRSGTSPQRLVWRSRIILLMLRGVPVDEIAVRLGVTRPTVRLWCARFRQHGPTALLEDAPGRGRRAALDPRVMLERLREANLLGPDGRPVSLRRAAAVLGVSTTSIWRAWQKLKATSGPDRVS